MTDEFPFHAEGPIYVCSACGKQIPDGASVLGTWQGGALTGVRAFIEDTQVHKCGDYTAIDTTATTFDINDGEGVSNG